jgi:flagellin-like protein
VESFLYHEVEIIQSARWMPTGFPGSQADGSDGSEGLKRILGRHVRFRARRSAVSPIIATILLVAITVVLAAVLYVMIIGYGHTTASKPLGTAFFAGPASPIVGTAQTNAFCQTKHYCYSIPIQEAGEGVTLGDLTFVVHTDTGSVHIVAQNFAQLSIVNEKNVVQASSKIAKNAAFAVTAWQSFSVGTTAGTALSSLQTIWVQFGNTKASPFGQQEALEVIGTGSFSGSVVISLP